jgi:hypothetical protein
MKCQVWVSGSLEVGMYLGISLQRVDSHSTCKIKVNNQCVQWVLECGEGD